MNKTNTLLLASAFFSLAFSLSNFSQAQNSDADYCRQAFEIGNMPGMTECTQEELQTEDKRLNTEYKRVMKNLDASAKKELRTRQRAWIKARDKACKLEEDSGQAGLLNHVSCLKEWTKKRANELAGMP